MPVAGVFRAGGTSCPWTEKLLSPTLRSCRRSRQKVVNVGVVYAGDDSVYVTVVGNWMRRASFMFSKLGGFVLMEFGKTLPWRS